MVADTTTRIAGPDADDEYVIENPATGEHIKFMEEPTTTGGDALRFGFWARYPETVGAPEFEVA